jgi:type VI secretion system secreted protein VgrG
VTNTGSTTLWGDLGTFPTTSESGVSDMTILGTDHAGDAVTQQAKTNLVTAYGQAAGALPPTSVATELGGRTLTPGIYNGATLGITGTLTLDTGGDPNAVFIFQTPETLVTATDSQVVVLNGGVACNVYWQVGTSASLGVRSGLIGTVMANTSITATTSATVQGRLLALNGAVTLDTNTITNTGCAASSTTTTTTTGGGLGTGGGAGATTSTAPGSDLGTTPGAPGTPGSSTTTTASTTSTTSTNGRPPLPFTGSDPRLPLAGAVFLATGVTALGLSKRKHTGR